VKSLAEKTIQAVFIETLSFDLLEDIRKMYLRELLDIKRGGEDS